MCNQIALETWNNMETYYPYTSLSFVNQKNEKNKKLKFVNENYI